MQKLPSLLATVFIGDQIAKRISMRLVHGIAALIFGVLRVMTLLNAERFS